MASNFFLDVRAPDFQEKMTAMYRALDGEDPLICALIGAAHIDKCLVTLLDSFFVQGKRTKLRHLDSEGSGVLHSLYTRAEFAYLLGLIDGKMLNNINRICHIRNLFAHSHTQLSFESAEIVKLCDELTDTMPPPPESHPDEDALEFWKAFHANPMHKFTRVTGDIVMKLAFLPPKLEPPNTPFIKGD